MSAPFFSICIPVYKKVVFLKRLLDSIFIQTFTDFEVVITDDSPDDAVSKWLNENYKQEQIHYYKNDRALGTPENWNEAIRKANGQWIKLMHDDDWFATKESLAVFHEHAISSKSDFYFSAYQNVILETGKTEIVKRPSFRWFFVKRSPFVLSAKNIIGPPSVILVSAKQQLVYDARMKWLVDIDYYIRLMQHSPAVYVNEPLVNVGLGMEQVTSYTHQNPDVEIPEALLMLEKIGSSAFKNILYFDSWWRLLRNMQIRYSEQFSMYAKSDMIPPVIRYMIRFQSKIPASLLKIGVISKAIMFLSWLLKSMS